MRATLLLSALAIFAGCGGGGGGGGAPAQVELNPAGASPSTVAIASGGQVRFVNHDTADHQIASSACSELASPRLAPNASFTATLGVGPKSCSFSDGLNPSNSAFQGTVSVGAPGTGGGGGGGGY